ncbi:MAG: TolC family protein [Prevotella sp.]|nr:TolC family protein [Prevotella sp.]
MKKLFLIATCVAVSLVLNAQQELTLSVEEMFALLEKNNTAIKVEQTKVEASTFGVEAAKNQRLPDIDASLSVSYNGNMIMMDRNWSDIHGYSSPRLGNNFSFEVKQMIYSGGALSAGVRISELERELSLQTRDLTLQEQRFIALGHYLDLYTLENREKVYESNIALTLKLIENINALFDQGMALKNDVTRYELQLSTLKLGLRKLQDLKEVKNRELCVSLSIDAKIIPDPEFIEQIFSPDEDIRSKESSWQQEALLFSPQIKLAGIQENIAEENVKLTRSEYLPKLNVFAVDSFTGPIAFEVPIINQNMNVWYVGLGLSWDIGALYKSSKKVKKSQLNLRQMKERQALTRERIGNMVFEAYTNYQQSFEELSTRRKSVKLAQENYQVVRDRYLNQLSLITDMIDASNLRLDAELLEVDARINVIYSYYKMKYISGTL